MISILNSISSGDLQVQQVPGEIPVKEDSIIDILQNSEIEFNTCHKHEIPELNFNTGFDANNSLHFDIKCVKTKTPLYRENYLREFSSNEEKAEARKSLGIYGDSDIITMNLLNAEDKKPSASDIALLPIKQMKKGDTFFAPITRTKAVLDDSGVSLAEHLLKLSSVITKQETALNAITQLTKNAKITSLGDVAKFLQGFNNGDNLKEQLDTINQDMLRFEKSGQIND